MIDLGAFDDGSNDLTAAEQLLIEKLKTSPTGSELVRYVVNSRWTQRWNVLFTAEVPNKEFEDGIILFFGWCKLLPKGSVPFELDWKAFMAWGEIKYSDLQI